MKLHVTLCQLALPLGLLLGACNSVDGSPAPGQGGAGGSGGSLGECGPGALDCLCKGGYFECVDDQVACICPPECASSEECGAGELCVFTDGYCGRDDSGYCQSLEMAGEWSCGSEKPPTCGCDGKLYDSYCDAIVAGVSPNKAPPSDCTAEPVPCSDEPGAIACYASTNYCMFWNDGSSPSCDDWNVDCSEPSCDCISYNEEGCDCVTLPSGVLTLTCKL